MSEETNDLTFEEIVSIFLLFPLFYVALVIGMILVVAGKILDFVDWVRKKIERLK